MNHGNFIGKYLQNKKVLTWENGLWLMVLAVGLYSLYIAISYASQLPLEMHGFRQTKSALVVYWLIQNGYGLAYETPIVGPPWTVPFSFPIYQHIVAIISDVLGTPLDPTGRMVSYMFLMACLVPASSIINKLQLHRAVFYIFVVLVLSSPQYLFWGRTFTMETTALFFSLSAIKYFVDAITDGFNRKNIVLFSIFMSLGLLQKITTAIPVLGVLSMVYLFQEAREWRATRTIPWMRITGIGLVCFLLPFMVGIAWVLFTDFMKMKNDFGTELLASNNTLLQRNVLGTLEERYSKDLLFKVVGGRIFKDNLGGILGLFIVLLSLIQLKSSRIKSIVLIASFLCILPLLLFPRLHIIHNYYQTANIIYLLFAFAVSLWYVVFSKVGEKALLLLLGLLVAWNYNSFAALYYGAMTVTKEDFHGRPKSPVAIGEILEKELPEDGQFIAFGHDWNPWLSYMSKRKSFTVPHWYSDYSTVLANPEQFLDEEKFGAAVYCSDAAPYINSIFSLAARKSWKVGSTHGCLIAASDPGVPTTISQTQTTECVHAIDAAEIEHRHGVSLISLAGWILTPEFVPYDATSNRFYFTISDSEEIIKYIGALAIHRPDINERFSLDYYENVGLSALVPVDIPVGNYSVNILRANDDKVEICKNSVSISIEDRLGGGGRPGKSYGETVNWRGEWASATDYYVNDVVSYQGRAYRCVSKHHTSTATELKIHLDNWLPSGENLYLWHLLADTGQDGADKEFIYAVTDGRQPEPTSNAWGHDAPGPEWEDDPPSLTFNLHTLWRAERSVVDTSAQYDATHGAWSSPKIVKRLQGEGEFRGYPGDDPENINWRGDWIPMTRYYKNDAVSYQGRSYVCLEDHVAGEELLIRSDNHPGLGEPIRFWRLMVEHDEEPVSP